MAPPSLSQSPFFPISGRHAPPRPAGEAVGVPTPRDPPANPSAKEKLRASHGGRLSAKDIRSVCAAPRSVFAAIGGGSRNSAQKGRGAASDARGAAGMSSAHVGPVPTCATRRLATVEWQITRRRYPSEPTTDELSTDEGRAVLTEAAQIGTGRVLLSGGDPTARADLVDLVAFGASLGLAMHVLAPAAPDRVHALLPKLTAAGLRGVAVALHGADA